MSSVFRSPLLRAPLRLAPRSRGLNTSATFSALRESSRDTEDAGQAAHAAKEEEVNHVKKNGRGHGGKAELKSESEDAIKADQTGKRGKEDIQELEKMGEMRKGDVEQLEKVGDRTVKGSSKG
ncbi:MAG: hypothetical protein M1814_000805 [Vezdaea aestivalis]|nr:MAG: hypothetical protein M1814_000805 [Vezdaea aestivalis]